MSAKACYYEMRQTDKVFPIWLSEKSIPDVGFLCSFKVAVRVAERCKERSIIIHHVETEVIFTVVDGAGLFAVTAVHYKKLRRVGRVCVHRNGVGRYDGCSPYSIPQLSRKIEQPTRLVSA